jgi:uncharacterized membrane protein
VGEVSRFLFTRGLWLVLLEVTIVRFAWTFSLLPTFIELQVIWVIGISMLVLSGLIYLPRWAIGTIGIGMILAHNLLDGIRVEQFGWFGWLWNILHQPANLRPAPEVTIFPLYSLIPWIGVMAAGFALGPVMLIEPARRRRWLSGLAAVVILGFVLLRATNLYGDPSPWALHDSLSASVLSFLNTEKYPPSALYLAMTLGPALLALAGFESVRGKLAQFFVVFGRVPLFYYVVHLVLLHALAVLFCGLPIGTAIGAAKPEGYGLKLAGVYRVWGVVVVALYLPCRWFAEVKRTRNDMWLSYL